MDAHRGLNFFGVFCSIFVIVVAQRLCTDGPPSQLHPSECCPTLPNVFDTHLNSSCLSRFGKNTDRQLQDLHPGESPKGNCVMECIANETKIYKGYGFFDAIAVKRIFMNSVSGNREWGEIVAKSVDVCVIETRTAYRNTLLAAPAQVTTFPGEILCHPISGYLFGCLQTEMFSKCPNMSYSTECEAMQQYANDCHIGVNYV